MDRIVREDGISMFILQYLNFNIISNINLEVRQPWINLYLTKQMFGVAALCNPIRHPNIKFIVILEN